MPFSELKSGSHPEYGSTWSSGSEHLQISIAASWAGVAGEERRGENIEVREAGPSATTG
jgi:hypothetical protein